MQTKKEKTKTKESIFMFTFKTSTVPYPRSGKTLKKKKGEKELKTVKKCNNLDKVIPTVSDNTRISCWILFLLD